MKRLTSIVFFVLTSIATRAGAQHSEPEGHVAPTSEKDAEALFNDARDLAAKGDWQAACPKLEQSYALDPRSTTLFRLGDCYEHVKRFASAWKAYAGAARAAAEAGEDKRAEFASKRANELVPKVSRLIITINDNVPGLVLEEGGEALNEARFRKGILIDPGEHVIIARAPHKKEFRAKVEVPEQGAIVALTIPALQDQRGASGSPSTEPDGGASSAPATPPDAVARPRRDDRVAEDRTLRTWSMVVGGAGIVVGGVGTGLILASDSSSGSEGKCSGACLPGVLMLGTGALALVVGVTMYLASLGDEAPPKASARLTPLGFRF